ncbi:hypothetical protein AAFA94_002681 [Enterococcus faecalis]
MLFCYFKCKQNICFVYEKACYKNNKKEVNDLKKICCILLLGFGIFYKCENVYAIDWNQIWNEATKDFVPVEDNFEYRVPGSDTTIVDNKVVQVTEDKNSQRGVVWAKNQLDMSQNWSTEMNLFLGVHLLAGNQNGDGMAFILHNDPRGKNAIGDFGERLGVWGVLDSDNYIKNGWGVEFDLYANPNNEPFTMDADIYGDKTNNNYGHIANSYTKVDGRWFKNKDNVDKFSMKHNDLIVPSSWGDRLNNGMIKTFKVSWKADTQEITYSISYYDVINNKNVDYGTVTKHLDMDKFGSNMLYWGFTGSTGDKKASQFVGFKSIPKTINVDVIPQETTLGKPIDINKDNLKNFFTLTSGDDVIVESIENGVDYYSVGKKTIVVKLKDKYNNEKKVEIPVNVKWGNSVVYGSYDYGANGRTSAAFTLYTESTPTIVASQGQNDDNLAIHSNFPNQQYYTFNWFDLSNKQILKIDESNNGDKYIKASGNELKKDKLKEWGTAQNQAVNYGDIVRAWQTETGKNWLYENEQKQAYNDDKKAVYYEITTSGYRPLHFNQLTPKTGKIPIYSTNKYLDEHVKDYIDLKGYSNIDVKGFVEYPDTTSSGDKRAKILVEETLTTGKKVQYEYEVTINIEPGTLTYTVPKTLTFKEFSKSKSEQIVQRKYSGSLGLLIKDNRGSNKQGNWTLTAKASSDLKGIAPYLIYRNEKGVDSYLNGSAVPVYTQDKQVSATEPLEVEVSNKWKSTDGILLKVPSKNNLASQEYSTTITWNLVEGP